jgi:hypothetical protein
MVGYHIIFPLNHPSMCTNLLGPRFKRLCRLRSPSLCKRPTRGRPKDRGWRKHVLGRSWWVCKNWWFWAIGLCNTRTEVLFWGYSFRSIHAKNTPTIEDIPQHGSRKCVVGRFQLVGLITQTIFSAALWSLWTGWTNLQRPRIIAPTIQIIHEAGLSRVIQGLHGLSRSFQPNMWHFPSIFSRAPWSSKTNVDSIRNGHLRGLGKNQGYYEMTCLQ